MEGVKLTQRQVLEQVDGFQRRLETWAEAVTLTRALAGASTSHFSYTV
jgi:hypothetical protein